MILTKIKAYAFSALGSVIAILSFLLLNERRKAAKKKAEEYKAIAHHSRTIAEKDNEIEGQTDSRRARAAEELDDNRHPDAFTDPNRLMRRKGKDS